MLFNLNEFLMSISFALDFVEMDILGVKSNHGKRTAYLSMKVAKELGLSSEKLHDLVALAILHDNGVSEKSLHDKFYNRNSLSIKSVEAVKEHCIIGEENIRQYPFITDVKDVIRYHHEKYNGTGLFNLAGEDIPLMAQIIHMADVIEVNFDLENSSDDMKKNISEFVNKQINQSFSEAIVIAFNNAVKDKEFWVNLKNIHIDTALKDSTPQYIMDLSIEEIRRITGVFSKIIDAKSRYTQRHSSDLSQKVAIMADYYKIPFDEKTKLIIAADLHDIGKLAVSNNILDSPSKLTSEEFHTIKKHPYFTRLALQEIKGFEEITEWASNHHEKLNGEGYPFGKTAKDLDFNSRLIACLDIYEALTEKRPYRRPLSHIEAMEVLNKMKDDGFIDSNITKDIDYVFGSLV